MQMRRGLHHMEGNGACLSDFLKIQKNICLEKCKVDEKIVPTFGHILKFLRFYFQFESRKIRFNSLQRTCFFSIFLIFFTPCLVSIILKTRYCSIRKRYTKEKKVFTSQSTSTSSCNPRPSAASGRNREPDARRSDDPFALPTEGR